MVSKANLIFRPGNYIITKKILSASPRVQYALGKPDFLNFLYFWNCQLFSTHSVVHFSVRIYGGFFVLHKYKRGKVIIYLRLKSVKSLQMRL